MTGKTLGVLGGMGPKATSLFFDKLVENTVASKDQDHINTIILNHATIPDRTKVIEEKKYNNFLQAVKKDFFLFEKAGVNNIAIPCNTSHYFFNQMQGITDINIINMIDETIKVLKNELGEKKKIAILATDGTIKTKIYEDACKKFNLIPYKPNTSTQSEIMNLIYRVKKGLKVSENSLESIITEMINKGCTSVILGCTELSTININKEIKKRTIDPLEVLVHQAIVLSGKQSKFSFRSE